MFSLHPHPHPTSTIFDLKGDNATHLLMGNEEKKYKRIKDSTQDSHNDKVEKTDVENLQKCILLSRLLN